MTVGIVGLGAAGIRAAMQLEKAGATVRLYEARGRIGGRLHTVDEGNGCVYEAGGEWIDADHYRALAFLHELNLEPNTPAEWPKRLFYKGKDCTEATVWGDALEDDLRVEAAARELCRSLTSPPWSNSHAAELDNRTLGDFLRENTCSERGHWWTKAKYRSDEGDDLDQIGLLGWLCAYLNYLERDGDVMSAYRFPGGASRALGLALERLHAEPQFHRVLTRVRQDATGVTLIFENGEERVDRAILTLPPPVLERIVFEPALSVGKRCAVEACRMSRAIKITMEFDRRWWTEEDWGGSMLCDSALQQTWDGSLAGAPILNAYICGEEAYRWTQLPDPVPAAVYELSQYFPAAKDSFERGWIADWLHDPYAQGAFSHTAPQYALEHMGSIAPPENRVHFAGEHTSLWNGFIEGAFESGERVATEVLAAS